jgi:hypothetical protein
MKYAITATRYFYNQKPRRTRHFGPDGEETWPTLAAARAEIARLDSGIYYQAHNEHGRASYRAVRVDRLPQYLRA